MEFRFAARFLRDDLFRWTLFRHRDVDCHVVTGQQSGSHWLNHLLAEAICLQYGVDRPRHIDDRVLIGHPRDIKPRPDVPQFVWTHHAPSPVIHSIPFRNWLTFPKYLVLVRDIRAAMVSRYEKRKEDFQMSFAEYIREQRFFANPNKWDLIRRISFFNAWGRVRTVMPHNVHIVHYESLIRDAAGELQRAWEFVGLPIRDPDIFHRAAEASTKEKMSRREEPGRRLDLVRKDNRDPVEWFDQSDRQYFSRRCRKWLKHPLGYDYNDWSSARRAPETLHTEHERAA